MTTTTTATTPSSAVQVAADAATAVAQLATFTSSHPGTTDGAGMAGYRTAGDVLTVLALLTDLAEHLPAVLDQALARLVEDAREGHVRHDDQPCTQHPHAGASGGPDHGGVVDVMARLHTAGWTARELALRLNDAAEAAAHLTETHS